MAGMTWVKLYTDIVDDPKLMRAARGGAPDLELLPWLLAFAGRANDNGRLTVGGEPADEWDLARGIPNATPERARRCVAVLLRLEILAPDDDGALAFTAWSARAGKPGKPSDEAPAVRERVKRHRERAKEVTPRNALQETPRNAPEEKERRAEGETEQETTTPPRAVVIDGDAHGTAIVGRFLEAVPARDRDAWAHRVGTWLEGHDIAAGVQRADVVTALGDYVLLPAKDFNPRHVRKCVERAMLDRTQPARASPAGSVAEQTRAAAREVSAATAALFRRPGSPA